VPLDPVQLTGTDPVLFVDGTLTLLGAFRLPVLADAVPAP
jgi:hypothetical protein